MKTEPTTIHGFLRSLMRESRDIFVESINMILLVAVATSGIILVGWLFSSDLPLQAAKILNNP